MKLQALVRGRIVRKQSADMLRRMQAMARIQARACADRVPILGSANSQVKISKFTRVVSIITFSVLLVLHCLYHLFYSSFSLILVLYSNIFLKSHILAPTEFYNIKRL